MRRVWTGKVLRFALVAFLGVLLTACGGGDGDEEPTATSAPSSAQPTVETAGQATPEEIVESPATAPVNTDMSSPGMAGTPQDSGALDQASTPAAATGESTTESPIAEQPVGQETPTSGDQVDLTGGESAAASPEATPVEADNAPTSTDATNAEGDASVGDGTTGAPIPSLDENGASAATPAVSASPAASPVAASGTPVAAAELPVVTSCDVENVPDFAGDVTTYVLTVDLNFRTGPGSDCDLIGDGPLGEFSDVDVIGGPVIREGEESAEWVQVQVGDQTGWLAFEFLEPAE